MVRALGVVIGVSLVIALLWIGGEMHYRNCIQTVSATVESDLLLGDEEKLKGLADCSRLPF